MRPVCLIKSTAIPGAISPALTVSNVTLAQDGNYDVVLTDAIGSFTSVPARLTVLLTPIIVQLPVNQTVVAGGDFTMSVEVTGNPLPFAYSWRRGSIVIATNSGNFRSNFITLNSTAAGLILTNDILSSNYTMRLVVYNDANNAPGVLVTFTNTVLADIDGDGLSDLFEQTFFGNNAAADRNADSDGDGMLNWQEQTAGTDPTNTLSYLRINSIASPGPTTVTFGAVSNRTYSVQYSDSFALGAWSTLASLPARSTNWTAMISDPASTTNRFYRLVTPKR